MIHDTILRYHLILKTDLVLFCEIKVLMDLQRDKFLDCIQFISSIYTVFPCWVNVKFEKIVPESNNCCANEIKTNKDVDVAFGRDFEISCIVSQS